MHYFAAMYFTIVIAIDRDWDTSYEALFELWFPASILIGLGALPAGRLADKWSSPGILIIMFLGMGLSTVICGLVETEHSLMFFLAALGLFSAIYHPVGIPWVIKTSDGQTGMRLAVNGIFGGLGAASAALVSGWLILAFGWRAAFWIPGILCTLIGVAMFWALVTGQIVEGSKVPPEREDAKKHSGDLKGVALMMLPVFILGLIYNTVQGALPKLFEEQMLDLLGGRIEFIGSIVGAVYVVGALTQILGGFLADRFPLNSIYVGLWLFQAPLLFMLAEFGGLPLAMVATALTMTGTAILPAENMMLSKFAPAKHQGVTFGVKFVVTFGAAPLGVFLITQVRDATGEFTLLFLALSIISLIAVLVAVFLPSLPAEAPTRILGNQPLTLE